jgi:5-methylcytosine-specific restriction endonuclease McrBC GTP-binding regulatory subunit McrB
MANYIVNGVTWGSGGDGYDYYEIEKKEKILIFSDNDKSIFNQEQYVGIKKGFRIIALAKVIGEPDKINNNNDLYNRIKEYNEDIAYSAWYVQANIYELKEAICYHDRNTGHYIKIEGIKTQLDKILQEIMNEEFLKQYIALLTNSRNIILHGAPGTGKTYLAKQIAKAMEAETEFVQFHPSYDYTDFVEGLRPSSKGKDSKEIGFERKDGVFKKFCKKALDCGFESIYKKYLEEIKDGEEVKISGNAKDGIEVVQQQGESSNQPILIKKESLANYLRTGVIDNIEQKKYIEFLAGKLKEKGYKKKNFVFIIDEINRGEMSKIFGELFFSIDPGYRGKKGAVKTQYSNMQQNANEFDSALGITNADDYGHFFVPENVYIIGTMNDIDRNVESMDFAIRRRFAFMEIEAEYTKESILAKMPNKGKLIECMTNINNAIWNGKEGIDGLSSAYHIGASYFLKYDSNSDDPVKDLWNYHLKPLLQEYLRGMEDEKGKLSKLEDVYNKSFKKNTTETNNNQPQDAEQSNSK